MAIQLSRLPTKQGSSMSSARPVAPAKESAEQSESRGAELPSSCAEALHLWLRWNSAYEHVTEEMFHAGQDQRKMEALMDEMDQLRRQAIDLSRSVLGY